MKYGSDLGVDEFKSWLTSEMQTEADNSKSPDYVTRKCANSRYEDLQHGVRLLDEYASRPSTQSQLPLAEVADTKSP